MKTKKPDHLMRRRRVPAHASRLTNLYNSHRDMYVRMSDISHAVKCLFSIHSFKHDRLKNTLRTAVSAWAKLIVDLSYGIESNYLLNSVEHACM